MRPRDIVGAWVDAFNRADAEALAAFYEDNAINHQVAEEPVEGREALREMFANGFARTEMVCIIENVFEDREWAILESRDPKGLRMWLLSCRQRQDRFPARLPGQAFLSQASRLAGAEGASLTYTWALAIDFRE